MGAAARALAPPREPDEDPALAALVAVKRERDELERRLAEAEDRLARVRSQLAAELRARAAAAGRLAAARGQSTDDARRYRTKETVLDDLAEWLEAQAKEVG